MENIISYRIGYADQPQLPLDRIAAAGITHVEIVVREPDQTAAEIKSLLDAHGLKTGSVSAPCPIGEDNVFDIFDQYAAMARELGGRVLFTSVHSGGMELAKVYDRLHQLGGVVAKHDVVIGMETHPDLCQNGGQQLTTMTWVNHPNVGVNFDTANIYYYNHEVDTVEEVKKIKDHVKSVHLKDTPGGFEDPNFPVFGQGVVDFKGVFDELATVDFHGPFTMELEGPVGAADSVQGMEANVVGCLNHLRGLGLIR